MNDPVRDLFERAAACDGDARRAILDDARRDSPEVCDEVEGMLRHLSHSDGVLDRAAASIVGIDAHGSGLSGLPAGPAPTAARHELHHGSLPTGTILGPFVLQRLIGVGGAAAVYEACPRPAADTAATEPSKLALKLVRPELVTGDMIARFEQEGRERTIAAALAHPGLTPLIAAGCAELDGIIRPYAAFELVEGPDILAFSRSLQLGLDAKLELIAQVCDAVHHAHERGGGLRHGRLRAASIVIAGRPRVLDLGMATLLGESWSDGLAAGDTGAGAPADDIAALGAITHELLTGRRPAAPPEPGGAPIPPSRFDPALRGELDSIILCAIAADPAQRYASLAEMASDIRRWQAQAATRSRSTAAREVRIPRRRLWQTLALATAAVLAGVGAKLLSERLLGGR